MEEVAQDAQSGSAQTGDNSKTLDDVYALLVEMHDADVAASQAAYVASSGVTSVVLDPSQFDRLSSLSAAGLQADVVSVGLLALILGAVVATAMTVHWRGSRG